VKAPIKIWNAADIGVMTRDVGLEGSLTHVIKTFAPKSKREAEILQGDPREATANLVARLREHRLI
jgi:electron transfer flavoprotein beta subunit